MKSNLLFIFLLLTCFLGCVKTGSSSNEKKGEISLDNTKMIEIFGDQKYVVLDEPLKTGSRDIYFAMHFVQDDIFNTAVAYELVGNEPKIVLAVKNFIFKNGDNTILWDFAKGNDDIFGFKLSYAYPIDKSVKNYVVGFDLITYFNKGKRFADNVIFDWIESKGKFIIYDPYE